MKKFYFLLCAMIAAVTITNAQNASNYFFGTKSNVALADISTDNVIMLGTNLEDVSSAVYPIGFKFVFNGVSYTSFSANVNGYMGLGESQVSNTYLNSFTPHPEYPANPIPYPGIAPWWEGLYTANNGGVCYKLSGAPGSRKLIVEWKIRAYSDNENVPDLFNRTFQVWLFEGSNKIQFVYGTDNSTMPNIYNAATIGIAASATNFLSYDETTAAVSNTTSYNQNRIWPASDNSFIFSPSVITNDPVVTPIAVSENSVYYNLTCPGAQNGSISLGSINGGNGNYSVSWTGPNGYTASGYTLMNLAKGVYTYTVTDAASSPSATGSFEILEPVASLENTYALVGLKTVTIGENNIIKGSIGNTGAGAKVSVDKYTQVKGFIKAAMFNVNSLATVSGGLINGAASVNMPAVYSNTANTSALSNLNIPDDYVGGAVDGNFKDVTVGKRAKVTFIGTIFGKVSIKEGADVIFNAADISLAEIQTENGKSMSSGIDFTTVTFSPNAIIRVSAKLNIAERNKVIASGATIYMSDNNTDAEKITVNGKSTTFSANVVMLRGKLNVKAADAANPGTMNGLFIAEEIVSDKYINWSRSLCSETATRPNVITEAILQQVQTINVFPNPSKGAFTIQLSKNISTGSMIVISDINGKMIMQRKISATEAGQNLGFNLSGYAPGLYLVKMINGTEVRTSKIMIGK